MDVKVSNIRLKLDEPEEELPRKIAERLGIPAESIARLRILRKSLDARKRERIRFVYSAEAWAPELDRRDAASLTAVEGVSIASDPVFEWPDPGSTPLDRPPIVVGAGPAGLFAAYFLCQSGFRPIVLERGKDVRDRVADVRKFDSGGPLDPESNYLFGEGGAGTFSDGKLTYRGGGPDVKRILEILAECHAKPSIVYEHRPHVGSNRLPLVVKTLRKKIEQMGGEIHFSCRVEDLDIVDGALKGVSTSSGSFESDVVVAAIGHSARDTYEMLHRLGVPLEFKPFQFGARIEQPQEQIDRARYGGEAGNPILGAADYELVAHVGERDLFTFCMCAGGYVMASVSEPGFYCTNGQSESRHDSGLANSGVVVTIDRRDVKSGHPLAGVWFQRAAERKAYEIAGRSYKAPIQRVDDFLRGKASVGKISSTHARGVFPTDLAEILPETVVRSLAHGLPILDGQIRGRLLPHATLTGPESRGSSPVRIVRDDSHESIGLKGLFPCGEGAGYAGGIVSAAVDGLRTARAIAARYRSKIETA